MLGGTHGGHSRGAPSPQYHQARACRGRQDRGAEGAGAEGAGAGPESHGHGQGRLQQGAGLGGGAAGQVPPNPASPVPVAVPVPRWRRGARPGPRADPLPSPPCAGNGSRTARSWRSSGWCGSRSSWRSSGRRLRPRSLAGGCPGAVGAGVPPAPTRCRGAVNKAGLKETLWWHHWEADKEECDPQGEGGLGQTPALRFTRPCRGAQGGRSRLLLPQAPANSVPPFSSALSGAEPGCISGRAGFSTGRAQGTPHQFPVPRTPSGSPSTPRSEHPLPPPASTAKTERAPIT